MGLIKSLTSRVREEAGDYLSSEEKEQEQEQEGN